MSSEHAARGHHHDRHRRDEHVHDEERHHDRRQRDMHIWLDPENAKQIARAIAEELSAVYPGNRDAYKANAADLISRIDTLDAMLRSELAELRDKRFVVFHDAHQYFERHYGLSAVGSIAFDPGAAPLPNHIRTARAAAANGRKMRLSRTSILRPSNQYRH